MREIRRQHRGNDGTGGLNHQRRHWCWPNFSFLNRKFSNMIAVVFRSRLIVRTEQKVFRKEVSKDTSQ